MKYKCFVVRTSKTTIVLGLFSTILLSIYLVGCGDQVTLSSAEQLTEFENAAPRPPSVDIDRLVKARIGGGPYRVVTGDVLELTMPSILQVVTNEESGGTEEATSNAFRISESGNITLPIVGEIKVAGQTLADVETAVINAYYPDYAVTRPSVFARVVEYNTAKVSIIGAIAKPGIYSLRSDQMSLIALLMEAGGIIDEGASFIRIIHREQQVPDDTGEVAIGTVGEPVGQLAEPDGTELVKPTVPCPSPAQIEVQLAFRQPTASSTVGKLTISYDDTILLVEQVDATSKIERLALLEKLAQAEPHVSTTDVGQKLCALAELLQPGSGECNGEIETINEHVDSDAGLYAGRASQDSTGGEALGEGLLGTIDHGKGAKSGRTTELGILRGPETHVLPVKGLNIPFADIVLYDGDSVIVERLQIPLFTVMGLVSKPGNFPYPPDVEYNLVQALAFAGGFNQAADPRYVTVYRLKADGKIVNATFKIVNVGNGPELTDALSISIKAGDIIAVEHTPRTRTNLFLDRVFRINIGTYMRLDDLWEN